MSEWLPIKDLPIRSTNLGGWHPSCLIFIPDHHGGTQHVAQLDAGMWLQSDERRTFIELEAAPTHWMPLPPPPNNATVAGSGEE